MQWFRIVILLVVSIGVSGAGCSPDQTVSYALIGPSGPIGAITVDLQSGLGSTPLLKGLNGEQVKVEPAFGGILSVLPQHVGRFFGAAGGQYSKIRLVMADEIGIVGRGMLIQIQFIGGSGGGCETYPTLNEEIFGTDMQPRTDVHLQCVLVENLP